MIAAQRQGVPHPHSPVPATPCSLVGCGTTVPPLRRGVAVQTPSLLPTPRSSASLPRSPDNPSGIVNNGGGSMMHGSNQEVYVNIYQNTNHPSLFVSRSL